MTEKQAHAFYDSAAWKQKRAAILRRDCFECIECRRRIEAAAHDGVQLHGRDCWIHRAVTVHHIKHLLDFPELALDDSNLESVCMSCHNRLHNRDVSAYCFKKKNNNALTSEKW